MFIKCLLSTILFLSLFYSFPNHLLLFSYLWFSTPYFFKFVKCRHSMLDSQQNVVVKTADSRTNCLNPDCSSTTKATQVVLVVKKPPWLRSRRVYSCSGHLREHNWEALPYPRRSRHPPCAARVRPAPATLQGRCPPSPVAPGEPRPHARFQERLSDLAAAARSNMRTIHTPHRDNPSCL